LYPASLSRCALLGLGDSLAVELPALDRATLVRIQVPQPSFHGGFMTFSSISPWFFSFIVTFLISLLLTRLMIAAGILAIPEARSAHNQSTPTAGGVAIVISFLAGAGLLYYSQAPFQEFSGKIIALVSGSLVLGAGVSLMDDMGHVPYGLRLGVQIIIALALFSVGLKIQCPLLQNMSGINVIEFFLTLLFIVFVINAANFVDGLNGLLSGSVITALPFMIMITLVTSGTQSGSGWICLICFILFAAVSGFFIFNFPRGEIFMGDVGSVFIGLVVGIVALLGQKSLPGQPTWLFIHARLFLLIYPLGFIWFDAVFTVIRRGFLGRSVFEPNRDFLLHLLHRAGYSHATVTTIYCLSVVLLGIMGLLTPLGYMPFSGLVTGYMILQALFVAFVFLKARQQGIKT
jgi:UDP-GlcNAc:undecaprenyl-phosphate GlcNAc-1-phosphate transferase